MKRKTRNRIMSLPVPLLILALRPLSLTMDQSVILAALVFTLTLWVNKSVNRSYASIFLLGVFLLFGNAAPERVFTFPLSDNFMLILMSFLFSEGIVKSRLIDRIIKPFIGYYGTSLIRLLLMIWAMSLLMIFIVPQPFARLILLATIFREYLEGLELKEKTRELISFLVFLIAIITNTFFLKGDIIMNLALIDMSGVAITDFQWMVYFLPPGLILLPVVVFAYMLANKKDLLLYKSPMVEKPRIILNRDDKRSLLLILVPLILWTLDGFHPISGTAVIIIGVLLMYAGKILSVGDIKTIQWSLLIFLTATFSIGPVMSDSGTASVLFGSLTPFFPVEFSNGMILAVLGISAAIHMVLGSVVTSMSVVLPGMALLTAGAMTPTLVALLVFISIALHFVLPFHNVVFVIGEGYEFFGQIVVMKTGLMMTLILLLAIFGLYLPWWSFVGVF